MTPREQQRLERHEEIVARALRTVTEQGIDALSMNKLAKQVGFTPGALYRYFDSKDALLAEIALRIIDEAGHVLERSVAVTPDEDPLGFLRGTIDAYLAFAADNPGALAFISVLLGDPRVLVPDVDRAAEVLSGLTRSVAPLCQALDAAVARGLLTDAPAMPRALSLFSSVQGALLLKKQERHDFFPLAVDALARLTVEGLLAGWSAPGERHG